MAAIGSPFFLIDDTETRSFNAIALEIKSGYSNLNVSNAVDDALLNNGIDLLAMLSVDMRLAQLQGHLNPTYLILKVMGIFTVLLGFLGLLIVLNLTIQERTREIGIMKSIGCSFRKISGMFRLEFLLVNVLSITLGILVAMPLTSALCRVLGEMVVFKAIPAKIDFVFVGGTTIVVLIVQMVLISIFNRYKIRKNARELLDHNF